MLLDDLFNRVLNVWYGVGFIRKFKLLISWCLWYFQHSKFASAVRKCRGISPFYSICLANKNAKAVKFLQIFKKIVFLELKNQIFVKKKRFLSKKTLFYKTQIIHVHLYWLFIPSCCIFLTHDYSELNRSSFPETLLCYALNEVTDVIHFFLSK